jgi:hypothetical protein
VHDCGHDAAVISSVSAAVFSINSLRILRMSLGLLVGQFGTFIRERHVVVMEDGPALSFPDELNDVRHAIAHHLIPLTLLARCDGDYAPQERDVIVAHCIAVAERKGVAMDSARILLFTQYVTDFRPTLMQLDPAIALLADAAPSEVFELVSAAHAVVDADGIERDEEKRLLVTLGKELRTLPAPA